MPVSFVKPELGQVYFAPRFKTYFRLIADKGSYWTLYALPALDDVLKFCQVSKLEYEQLCERYRKWVEGDSSATPVLAYGLIAGGKQAPDSDDPVPSYLRIEQPQSTPPKIQVVDDTALMNAYNEQAQRFSLDWTEWKLYIVKPKAQVKDADLLTLEELKAVADPFAPLLRTAQNEAEATKLDVLAPLLRDLDLNLLGEGMQKYGEVQLFRIAHNFRVPSGFAQQLLHVWSIFGATPEGLLYAKEVLSRESCPDLMSLFFAAFTQQKYLSVDNWAYDSLWIHMYEMMVRNYLWDHAQEALAWNGVWSRALLKKFWDQKYCDDFGRVVVTAFGGPQHSFLWQFKHSQHYAPDNFDNPVVIRIIELLYRAKEAHSGGYLKAEVIDRFGINPHYGHYLCPLPRKLDFVYDEKTRAQILAKSDLEAMGTVLEGAAMAFEQDFYPEAVIVNAKPERGCFTMSPLVTLSHLNRASKKQARFKQLIPPLVQHLRTKVEEPCAGACAYSLTEMDVASVKMLAAEGIVRFVYGVADPNNGAFSTGAITNLEVKGGVRAQECHHLIDLYMAKPPKVVRTARKKPVSKAQANAELAAFARKIEQELAAKRGSSQPRAKKSTVNKSASNKATGGKATAKKSAAKK